LREKVKEQDEQKVRILREATRKNGALRRAEI